MVPQDGPDVSAADMPGLPPAHEGRRPVRVGFGGEPERQDQGEGGYQVDRQHDGAHEHQAHRGGGSGEPGGPGGCGHCAGREDAAGQQADADAAVQGGPGAGADGSGPVGGQDRDVQPGAGGGDSGHDRQVDGGEGGDGPRAAQGRLVGGPDPGPPQRRQGDDRRGQHHGKRDAPGPQRGGADQAGNRFAEYDQDEYLEPVGQVRGVQRDLARRGEHRQRAGAVGEQGRCPDGVPQRAADGQRGQPYSSAGGEEDQVPTVQA